MSSLVNVVDAVFGYLHDIFFSSGNIVDGVALPAGSTVGKDGFQSVFYNIAEIFANIGRGSSNLSVGTGAPSAIAATSPADD